MIGSMDENRADNTLLPAFHEPRPGFHKPPVNEVALSVQFSPVSGLTVAMYGLLWQRYRPAFSKSEDKAPLASVIETFEAPRPQKLKFEIVPEPQPPRCWFMNEKGSELIQVQSDRFVFNWRKQPPLQPYPRYEHVRIGFERYYSIFEAFAQEYNLGPIVPTQCEVTYVNDLNIGEGWFRFGELRNVLALWAGEHSDKFLEEPEDAQVRSRYVIRSNDGLPLGRLHINLEPRIRVPDGSSLMRLVLTARGAPLGEGIAGIISFLNLGREYVVRGFTSITTKRMHEIWERYQ